MAGLLADVFSFGDTAKRKVKGLLADPVGTLQQFVGNENDRAGRFNELTNSAAQEMATRIKSGGSGMGVSEQRLAGLLADSYNPAGMVVWHGSPHKFNKFDSSKIGTGEGAQAYGHGLYLAESPAVADGYRTALAQPTYKPRGHAEFDDWVNSAVDSAETSRGAGEYIVKLARQAQSEGKQLSPVPKGFKSWADFSKNARKAAQQTFDESGSLYKVDLPDEHIAKMLDWDKPLSQQPKEVLDFARKALDKEISNAGKVADGWGDLSAPYDALSELTGQDLVYKLRPNLNMSLQNITGGGGPEVSNALRQAGIPGIRYLDGGSRGAGAGSSNFVVFPGNEDFLKILERNGQPMNGLLGN